jgi:hypothetical protein
MSGTKIIYQNATEALLDILSDVAGDDICYRCKNYDPKDRTMCKGPGVAGWCGKKHRILACTGFEPVMK